MAIRRFAILLLLTSFSAIAIVHADDLADVETKLVKAREIHAEAMSKVRKAGVELIDKEVKVEKKKKRPNPQTLEALKAEGESLEKGALPKRVQDKFQKQITEANKKLIEALGDMSAAYSRADVLDKAKAIEKEMDDLKSRSTSQPNAGDDAWVPLFNGKDLGGWRSAPGSKTQWEVSNRVLWGTGPSGALLTARDDFQDFRLRIEAMINDDGNSGVFFRVLDNDPGRSYEAQINSTHHTDPNRSGSLYILNGRQNALCVAPMREILVPPGHWFTLEVVAQGNNLNVFVNGKETAKYIDQNKHFSKGSLGLQQHHPGSVVAFRRIEIQEMRGGNR